MNLTEREMKVLRYALSTLLSNFDDMAEDVLDTPANEGENEVRQLAQKLGFDL